GSWDGFQSVRDSVRADGLYIRPTRQGTTPMTRISAGLACITLSIIFAANALGFVPDRTGALIEGRKKLSEALAVSFALAAQQGDVAAIIVTTREIQRRNGDLEWA